MASIHAYETKKGVRWRVAYDGPDHRQHTKRGFKTKREATNYCARIVTSLHDGTYIDPREGEITVGMLAPAWLKAKSVHKPTYVRDLESAWRVHVEPRWANVPISAVRHSDIQAWVSELGNQRSASVTLRAFGVLKGICDAAIADRRITVSPCTNITLPRKLKRAAERHYLTASQLLALAESAGRWGPLVLTLGFCGIRYGEATALTVGCVDLEHGRLHIRESMSRVGSRYVTTAPKTWEMRDVPMPPYVAEQLRPLVEGRDAGEYVFTRPNGEHIIQQSASIVRKTADAYQWWGYALKAAGLEPMKIHDLRHTAASLAVSAGANVKLVQRMLGHESASVTLDTYADLFDHDLDSVSAAMNELIAAELEE